MSKQDNCSGKSLSRYSPGRIPLGGLSGKPSSLVVVVFFFLFLWGLTSSAFGVHREIEEKSGYLKIFLRFSEEELNSLKEGQRVPGFDYVFAPEKPALTAYPLYVALPDDPELSLKSQSHSELVEGTLPLLMEDGSLLSQAYDLPQDWFPEEPVMMIKKGVIRQVPFVLLHLYPIQISQKGLRVHKEIILTLTYNPALGKPVEEPTPFQRIYDALFINRWQDKGIGRPQSFLRRSYWQPPQSLETIYKIPISTTGVYGLSYTFLSQNTDWDVDNLNPKKIHLYTKGQEIPLWIEGEADQSFDPGDTIYFYGQALEGENLSGVWQKGDFTDTNIYWLTVEATDGLRMGSRNGNPVNGYPQAPSFPYKKRFEVNQLQVGFVPHQDDDHWMWDYARWLTWDQKPAAHHYLDLKSISNNDSYNATLTYEIRGSTYDNAVNPDHHVLVKINGNLVDDVYFDDYYFYQNTVTFPQSYLNGPGDTTVDLTVEVTDPSLLGTSGDQVWTNWFEITYERGYEVENNGLTFSLPEGSYTTTLENFTNSHIVLLDISQPSQPIWLTGGVVAEPSPGAYTLTFEDAISLGATYSYRAEVPLAPSSLIPYAPADLLSLNPQYVIIAPGSWISSPVFQDYLNFRQSQGLTVAAVAIEDIYDSFNYGIFSPLAIRDFLETLYSKTYPPTLTYVLIIGDADHDFKDYAGDGNYNVVPTYMETCLGYGGAFNPLPYYSFEHYFGTFNGNDDLPEIFIGRISAKTQGEMEEVLTKIQHYESTLPDLTYLKNILNIADCRDHSSFENAQNLNESYVTQDFSVERMYLSDPPYTPVDDDCSQVNVDLDGNGVKDVVDRFNTGKGIVNYIGHGSFLLWSDKAILRSPEDMPDLTNNDMPSVVLNSNCYTGAFYHSNAPTTLIEDLMNRPTGAVSAIAPGTYMYTFQSDWVTEPWFSTFFGPQKERQMGPLYYQSFARIEAGEALCLVRGLVVFGDPATVYAAPTPQAPINFTATYSACRTITLAWQPPDSNAVYQYNLYRAESPDGPYSPLAMGLNTPSYEDTDLIYGKTYYYVVAAVHPTGFEGKWSSSVNVYAEPCPPATPGNVTCLDVGLGGRITVSWDPVDEPELTGYSVYYGGISGNYTSSIDVGGVTSYQLSGLTDGVAVYIVVTAKNSFALESSFSQEVSCIPTHTAGWHAPKMIYPLSLTKDQDKPVLTFSLPTENLWGDAITASDLARCSIYRSDQANFIPDRSSTSTDRVDWVDPLNCSQGICTWTDDFPTEPAFYYVTCETFQGEESSIANPPPRYPSNVSVRSGRANRRIIEWDPITQRMDGSSLSSVVYWVFRSLDPNFLPDLKDKTNFIGATTDLLYVDVPPDKQTYYYKLVGVDEKENGGPF